MLVVAFAYFLFLIIDIRVNVNRAKKVLREREARHQIIEEYVAKANVRQWNRQQRKSFIYSVFTIFQLDIDGPIELRDISNVTLHQRIIHELNLAPIQSVPHKYCFATGRHGEFLYLKLGAACKSSVFPV